MALTLQQYAEYLDTRNLHWPAPPQIDQPEVQPRLVHLADLRAVTWSVYGTLVAITGGELFFEHPDSFVMDIALDKTIQEFKMWGAMTRKPGQPASYLRQIYTSLLMEQRTQAVGGEKYFEIQADRLWESFIKKLLQKDYRFEASFFGSLNEFSRKVAYFFHASLQGTACFAGAAEALLHVKRAGLNQGLIADAQCFTPIQLERGLQQQTPGIGLDALVDQDLRAYSYEVRARKPSERLFRPALAILAQRGITPKQVLHVGSRLVEDLVPARRLGMRTAWIPMDVSSRPADQTGSRDSFGQPDVLLTKLDQIAQVVG